ncbi:MAG TPA: TetR/AcrR family transcriptional regulator [Micromonosporaceae bacterium]
MAKPAGSIRARVRAEMIDEIKIIARRHLATDGANLSLRAVARDMGMVSSAIYRYFPSRDDLLTALIIDAYNEIGAAAEAGDASVDHRTDLRGRFVATAAAIRRWALAKPAEYALLYGSPVPGYVAPMDTTAAAVRTPLVLIQILADGFAAGTLTATTGALPDAVRADLVRTADQIAPGLPPEILMRGMTGWIHLFGAVSFELFGQLNNVIEARTEYFDRQIDDMADLIGLPG